MMLSEGETRMIQYLPSPRAETLVHYMRQIHAEKKWKYNFHCTHYVKHDVPLIQFQIK